MVYKIFLAIYLFFSFIMAHGEEHDHDHNHNYNSDKQKYKSNGVVRGSIIDNVSEEKNTFTNQRAF